MSQRGVDVAEGATTVTLRLEPARTITGRVVGADGKPASPGRVWVGDDSSVSAYVDASGKFRLEGVRKAALELRFVGTPGDGRVALDAAATEATITLESRAGAPADAAEIVVRVVDPEGRPVPRARLSLESDRSRTGMGVVDGVARFSQSQREGFSLYVSDAKDATGRPLPLGTARLPLDPRATEVVVRLPPERFVSGVVRTPDGKGLRGVLVTAAGKPAPTAASDPSERLSTAYTDVDGAYRVGRLGDEDVDLRFGTPPEYVLPDAITVKPGRTDVDVVLRRGLSPTVTVVGPDGAPVESARVGAAVQPRAGREREPQPEVLEATTNAQGRATLLGIDPDRSYSLSIRGPDSGNASAFLPYSEARWIPRDETIRLSRAHVVRGVVRDAAGKPIEGVNLTRRSGENSWTGVGRTDAKGEFTVRDLAEGPVTLRASAGTFRDAKARYVERTVPAGTTDLVLTLDPGVVLSARIENWAESGTPHAHALLLGDDGSVLPAVIGTEGAVRWEGLSPDDSFTLWIAPTPSGMSAYRKGVRPGDHRVRIEPGLAITGRVRAPSGVTEVSVQASLGSGSMSAPGKVGADGTYEIRGLPPGLTWTVTGFGRMGTDFVLGRAEGVASGGTADVELKPRER